MKKLELNQMEVIEVGKTNGWGCADAIFGSLAITVRAAAITAGIAWAGVALAVFLVAKTGGTLAVIGACS